MLIICFLMYADVSSFDAKIGQPNHPSIFYSLLFICEIRRRFSDIPEAGRMTARLVIVWIWSLSGGQREREKNPPTACQRSMGVGVREPSK